MNIRHDEQKNSNSAGFERPTPEEWGDWKWQRRNSVKTLDGVRKYFEPTKEECEAIVSLDGKYAFEVTPYYMSLIDPNDPNCPIRLQAIPSLKEMDSIYNIDKLESFHKSDVGSENPLWKEGKTTVSNIVWRYPDRIVFHMTNLCAVYCRHCCRKVTGETDTLVANRKKIDEGIKFVSENPAIRDVLLTGGDPLMVGDNLIEYVVSRLRAIAHVEIIRLGTRNLVTLPQRITDELCGILKKHHPVWINTHFNHANELTDESIAACDKLLSAGIPLGNQHVLMKGVNDTVDATKELMLKLVKNRIRPYYMYHADLVRGTEHFRTSVETGLHIMENLRGHISGYAVPTYVISTPIGKVPLSPNYLLAQTKDEIVVRNWEWRTWRDPNLSVD